MLLVCRASCSAFAGTSVQRLSTADTASSALPPPYLMCPAVHLAAKLLEDVRPLPLLQHMLQTIFQSTVTRQQTEALEAQCLRALDWRLGPFFND